MTEAQAGRGAVALQGVLIDAASIRQAEGIVKQMQMIRERTGSSSRRSQVEMFRSGREPELQMSANGRNTLLQCSA